MHRARPQTRSFAPSALLLLALLVMSAPSFASERRHGLSAFGDLGYPADFTHFAYASPDAPKGGTFSLVGWGGVTTFNSLNNYILKGDAAQGLELLFDSLMIPATDEPDAVYGLVAESAEIADDGMSTTYSRFDSCIRRFFICSAADDGVSLVSTARESVVELNSSGAYRWGG